MSTKSPQRLQSLVDSQIIIDRLQAANDLAYYISMMDVEDGLSVGIPCVVKLCKDDDYRVRTLIFENLKDVILALLSSGQRETVYNAVSKDIFPVLLNSCKDNENEVRDAASYCLISMGPIFSMDDLNGAVLDIIKLLGHSEQEEHLVLASLLINEMCMYYDTETCVEHFFPIIEKMVSSTYFRVRKAIACNMEHVAECISKEMLEHIKILGSDRMWGVRKACVETLVLLSEFVSQTDRVDVLLPLFNKCISDSSRWVRSAAYKSLGKLISTFEYDMVSDTNDTNVGDNEIVIICAFNFPAVLYTVGKAGWMQLGPLHKTLAHYDRKSVRKTLAYSLHEIAKIVGIETTKNELLAIFDLYLKDLPEIQFGVVSHFAEFISLVDDATQQKYIENLSRLSVDPKWRIRNMIASQMPLLCSIYVNNLDFVLPLVYNFLEDPVHEVRLTMISVLGELLDLVGQENTFFNNIIALGKSENYINRITYCKICEEFAEEQIGDEIYDNMVGGLIDLHKDKVPNVRIAVAKSIALLINCGLDDDEIIKAQDILCEDSDMEVRMEAAK